MYLPVCTAYNVPASLYSIYCTCQSVQPILYLPVSLAEIMRFSRNSFSSSSSLQAEPSLEAFKAYLQGSVSRPTFNAHFQGLLSRLTFKAHLQGLFSMLTCKAYFQGLISILTFKAYFQGSLARLTFKAYFQGNFSLWSLIKVPSIKVCKIEV